MMGRRPMGAQGGQMLGSRVTLVLRQSIKGVRPVPLDHLVVAFYLSQNRGRRNRNRACIPMNEGFLLDQHVQLHSIQKQIVRLHSQLAERFGHRLAAGLINVPGIDASRINLCDRPRHGVFTNPLSQNLATGREQFFGIIQADNPALGVEDHCRGNHRTEERAASYFIQAGDALPAVLPGFPLESGRALPLHRRGFYHAVLGGAGALLRARRPANILGYQRKEREYHYSFSAETVSGVSARSTRCRRAAFPRSPRK